MDRRQALATGVALPRHSEGAAIFADVSGFTSLSHDLAQEPGPQRRAEEPTRQLNHVYGALPRDENAPTEVVGAVLSSELGLLPDTHSGLGLFLLSSVTAIDGTAFLLRTHLVAYHHHAKT
jgi:hypothetical protein